MRERTTNTSGVQAWGELIDRRPLFRTSEMDHELGQAQLCAIPGNASQTAIFRIRGFSGAPDAFKRNGATCDNGGKMLSFRISKPSPFAGPCLVSLRLA